MALLVLSQPGTVMRGRQRAGRRTVSRCLNGALGQVLVFMELLWGSYSRRGNPSFKARCRIPSGLTISSEYANTGDCAGLSRKNVSTVQFKRLAKVVEQRLVLRRHQFSVCPGLIVRRFWHQEVREDRMLALVDAID
jgi:hypothetical protein